jgi:hypothetical protein
MRERLARWLHTGWGGKEPVTAASVTAATGVSGHKTQLYLVAASTGGPASGSRCGFCDTTYNCSCGWTAARILHDRPKRAKCDLRARSGFPNSCFVLASGPAKRSAKLASLEGWRGSVASSAE